MIEAEFHCIWENPEKNWIDITPKNEKGNYIIFIPDYHKIYEGKQINNIRRQLTPDPLIKRFIELFNENFRLTNEGDLAYQHGVINIDTEEFQQLARELLYIENMLNKKYGNIRSLY